MHINSIIFLRVYKTCQKTAINNVHWVTAQHLKQPFTFKWKRQRNVEWMVGQLVTNGTAILKRLVMKKRFSIWTKNHATGLPPSVLLFPNITNYLNGQKGSKM